MGSNITMDEMAAEAAIAAKPDLTKILMDGDDVPEHLRGKSAADVLAHAKGVEAALRASEEGRKQAQQMAELAVRQPAPPPSQIQGPPPPPPEPKDLTLEELTKLAQEDTGKALALAMEQTARKVTKNVDARMAPLISSTYSAIESQARERYKSDFAVLGPEIQKTIDEIPANQRAQALGDPKSWEMLINYVRGQNMDKLLDAKIEARMQQGLATARAGEAAAAPTGSLSVGAANSVGQAAASASRGPTFDALTLEIMRNTGFDDTPEGRREYTKWFNAGTGFLSNG